MTQFPDETNSVHVCMCALPGPLLTSITWPVERWSSLPGFLLADHTSVENQGMSPWHSQHLSLYSCRLAEQRAPALLPSLSVSLRLGLQEHAMRPAVSVDPEDPH